MIVPRRQLQIKWTYVNRFNVINLGDICRVRIQKLAKAIHLDIFLQKNIKMTTVPYIGFYFSCDGNPQTPNIKRIWILENI